MATTRELLRGLVTRLLVSAEHSERKHCSRKRHQRCIFTKRANHVRQNRLNGEQKFPRKNAAVFNFLPAIFERYSCPAAPSSKWVNLCRFIITRVTAENGDPPSFQLQNLPLTQLIFHNSTVNWHIRKITERKNEMSLKKKKIENNKG